MLSARMFAEELSRDKVETIQGVLKKENKNH